MNICTRTQFSRLNEHWLLSLLEKSDYDQWTFNLLDRISKKTDEECLNLSYKSSRIKNGWLYKCQYCAR